MFAQAAHRQQREAPVRSGLAQADAQLALDLADHGLVATDVADHAVAHANDVAADRLAEDLAVERRHAFNVAGGDAEDLADGVEGAVRHPATLRSTPRAGLRSDAARARWPSARFHSR
eukprot:gene6960-8088_t